MSDSETPLRYTVFFKLKASLQEEDRESLRRDFLSTFDGITLHEVRPCEFEFDMNSSENVRLWSRLSEIARRGAYAAWFSHQNGGIASTPQGLADMLKSLPESPQDERLKKLRDTILAIP